MSELTPSYVGDVIMTAFIPEKFSKLSEIFSGSIGLKIPHSSFILGKIQTGSAPVKTSPFKTDLWQFLPIKTLSFCFKVASIAPKIPDVEPFTR